MPANSRFSDNPFRDPNLPPEQVAKIEARNEAYRVYRETGDTSKLEELGLYTPKEENTPEIES